MTSQKILICDDDHTVLKLYRMILEQKGFKELELAQNGKEAINKYEEAVEKPTIVIMDHRMPLLSGLDAMKIILEKNNRTRIIFASADSTVKNEVLSMGAFAFISKPFDIEELLNSIRSALNSIK
ncbi:MAG: Signal transduction response regulator [Promethearchaeota archaeon]|nr:MAG: Signal transduction response regulator [Candidatus Lokiarchaeota archaeon]